MSDDRRAGAVIAECDHSAVKRSANVVAIAFAAAASFVSCSSESSVTIADAPAECAGEASDAIQSYRLDEWSALKDYLSDGDTDARAWVSFEESHRPDDVASVIGPLPVTGVLLAFALEDGTTLKLIHAQPDDSTVVRLARTALDGYGPTDPTPEDPDMITAGAPNVAGVLVHSSSKRIAEMMNENECEIFAARVGTDEQGPALSPKIDP